MLLGGQSGGLLSGAGPLAVKQMADQRLAQNMAQGGRPMVIPATAPRPGPSVGDQIGEGLGALGNMLGQFGEMKQAAAAKETRMKAIGEYIETLPELERARHTAMAAAAPDAYFEKAVGAQFQNNEPNIQMKEVTRNVTDANGLPTGKTETITVGWDPRAGKVVNEVATATSGGPQWRMATDEEKRNFGVGGDGRAAYQVGVGKANAGKLHRVGAGQTINLNNNAGVQQTKEQKDRGATLNKEYERIVELANAAELETNQMRMALSLSDVDADGNELPSMLQNRASSILVALGMNPETNKTGAAIFGRVTDGQSFIAMMENAVLTKMQAQKGPQTENDTKRIKKTVASLGNTPAARKFLLRSAIAYSERNLEKRYFFDQYWGDKGTYEGAAKSWRTHAGSKPLFGINPNSNTPVFYREFESGMRNANPGVTDQQILDLWKSKYGKRVN